MNAQQLYESALCESYKNNADLNKVKSLLESSLDMGNSEAAYALGTWYLHGKHVKKNIRQAIALLRFAAKSNVASALFDMAVCYEKGIGVKINNKLAFENYLRSSLYGDKQAIYEIGRCYYYGIGTSKSKRLAWIWLDRASELGITASAETWSC